MPEAPVRLEELDGDGDGRRFSPSAARNRAEILPVFREHCPNDARVLEIASGTGEHAVHICSAMPQITWQTSDRNPEALTSIRAWRAHSACDRLAEPIHLDVEKPWPDLTVDVVFVCNFFHITPWSACCALFDGAATLLRAGGCVLAYGAFLRDGVETAPSNLAFDRDLRAQDSSYGVRHLDALNAHAETRSFLPARVTEMPRNNLFLSFAFEGQT